MPEAALARLRLVAQGLIDAPFASPADAVAAFGAMQGQDLPGVVASAALRSTGEAADVVTQFNDRSLVRGYPMRGTVFLMNAADAAWMTELCAEPARRAAAARRARLDIEEGAMDRVRELAVAFIGEGAVPRADLFAHWTGHGFPCTGGRGYHLLTSLVQDGDLIYGPWEAGDHLVAASAHWLPATGTLAARFDGERIPAVAELMRRYFTSHGPATIRDFAWWTKLTLGEIRAALPLVEPDLETDGAAEARYWAPGLLDRAAGLGRAASQPLLLPGFDEFILGYQDRLFAMTVEEHQLLVPGNNGVFKPTVISGGIARGLWRRGGRPGRRRLEVTEFGRLSATATRRLQQRFDAFPFAQD